MILKTPKTISFALMSFVLALWFLAPPAGVQAEEDFFKGKTIRFIAGSTPGGGPMFSYGFRPVTSASISPESPES